MPPPWLTEAVLLLEIARDSALLSKMQQSVRVPRGRMGTFEVCDFFLVLLAYAVSGEVTLLALYAAMAPSVALLGALWSRKHLPARCTLSRFLAAVTQPATEALRKLLFEDLLLHGLSGEQVGGLVDRVGVHHVVFDVDGTRQVARQRQVVSDDLHPPVQRRLDKLCAPGYPGRKRGEVVRTRSTVQQSHTSEWLGTFGAAGNGDALGDLDAAARDIARYLRAHGLPTQQGLVRLDGLYGHVRGACQLQHHGLGYLMRTADYRLLQDPLVQQVLTQPMRGLFVQPDTGTVREVFEVNALDWVSADHTMQVRCRLIITRCAVDKKRRPRVGKRQGDWMLELFVSDRDAQGLSAMDLLSLYFARGGFEQTLAQEDQEQDPDRWCSAHPAGQECWQLLSQWVWNVRVRLGAAAGSAKVRRTLWAPAQAPTDATAPPAETTAAGANDHGPPQPAPPLDSAAPPAAPTDATAPSVETTAADANDHGPPQPAAGSPPDSAAPPAAVPDRVEPVPACPAPVPEPLRPLCPGPAPSEPVPCAPQAMAQGQVAAATGRGSGRFAGSDFVWTPQQQLRCPAGKFLKPRQRTVVGERLQIRYQARISDCATCPLSAPCRGTDAAAKRGRRVTVWAPVPTPSELPLPTRYGSINRYNFNRLSA